VIDIVADILSWLCIGIGSALGLIGAFGLLRLPDMFARLHAAGMVDTGGAVLILVGLMFQGGLTIVTVKLALVIVFLLFTSPTTSHALAAAAIADGLKPQAQRLESRGAE